MEKEKHDANLKNTNRRDFLKSATTALAGVGAAGLISRTSPANAGPASGETAQNWDQEADVIVAGYGGAGAAAAIAAHDAGAKVLILESTVQGGGNTLVSAGGFLVPNNAKDAVTYISYLFDACFSERDDTMVRVFVEESMKNIEWLKGLKEGVGVIKYGGAGYPGVAGANSMEKYMVLGKAKGLTGGASNLFDLLRYAVEEKRKIPIMYQTPARDLVTDSTGKVIGIIAETSGKKITIHARRGIILTTGGFEANSRMLKNYVKGYPVHFIGHPGNKGDGVRMAQNVGADLWHMNAVSCALGLKVPDYESAFFMKIRDPGHIFVDKHGKRFVNETHIESHAGLLAMDHYDTHEMQYPRIPSYAIFDESVRKKGPISIAVVLGTTRNHYTWSKDNMAEIEKGWIKKGDTLAELAEEIHVDPASLEETVSKWNQDVASGRDKLFHRKIKSGKAPITIESAPYYAVEMYPALLNTQGGPRRNEHAQILNANGKPIPGLYSAGELGSLWGMIYQGAGNIAECMVFGRIAGRNAAAQKMVG